MKKWLAIRVKGRVQHVGFRYFAVKEAHRLNVCGMVRNETDGSVYIEASASEEQLDQFILSMKKGPSWSRVDDIQLFSIPPFEADGFSTRH